MTNLSKAVDAAIADENGRFLADPQAVAEAQAEGDLYRRRLEADGTLPALVPVPTKISAQWSIREHMRSARLEAAHLTLMATNRRTDRGYGPVKWLVAHDQLGTVAHGDVWQSKRYSSLVREAMWLAELAAAEYSATGTVAS